MTPMLIGPARRRGRPGRRPGPLEPQPASPRLAAARSAGTSAVRCIAPLIGPRARNLSGYAVSRRRRPARRARRAAPRSANASTTSGSNCVPAPPLDLRGGVLDAERLLVRALVDEHVEHVGDVHEPPHERDVGARQRRRGSPCRPSARGGSGRCSRRPRAAPSRASASTRAPASAWVLTTSNSAVGEPPGLEQDRVRDRDLADVVQRRGVADVGDARARRARAAGRAARPAPRRARCARACCRRGTRRRARAAAASRSAADSRSRRRADRRAAASADSRSRARRSSAARSSSARSRAARRRGRRLGRLELGGGDERRAAAQLERVEQVAQLAPRRRRARRSRRARRRAPPGRRPRRPAPTVTCAAAGREARARGRVRHRPAHPPAMSTRVPASASSIIEHHGGTRRPAPRHRDRRLPHRGAHRPGRDGRRLPRPAHEPAAARGDQDHRPGVRRHQGLPLALHPRGADRRRAPAPQHRHGLRRRPVGRDALHRDAVHPRLRPRRRSCARRAGCGPTARSTSAARSRRRSTPRTAWR